MKFHERFNIEINIEEAKQRFVNRTYNLIFSGFVRYNDSNSFKAIATKLGKIYDSNNYHKYILGDYYNCLAAIEAVYEVSHNKYGLNEIIKELFDMSEIDLGIKWENGVFLKTGAGLLDDKLVNDPLNWLRKNGFENVSVPFEKGLRHFLESDKRSELLYDVITDMYESLEGLAKNVTGRDKDLSTNAELFVSKINATEDYKRILKEYIGYANEYRHGLEEGKQRPRLNPYEVESFMYLTGLFIRLAMN